MAERAFRRQGGRVGGFGGTEGGRTGQRVEARFMNEEHSWAGRWGAGAAPPPVVINNETRGRAHRPPDSHSLTRTRVHSAPRVLRPSVSIAWASRGSRFHSALGSSRTRAHPSTPKHTQAHPSTRRAIDERSRGRPLTATPPPPPPPPPATPGTTDVRAAVTSAGPSCTADPSAFFFRDSSCPFPSLAFFASWKMQPTSFLSFLSFPSFSFLPCLSRRNPTRDPSSRPPLRHDSRNTLSTPLTKSLTLRIASSCNTIMPAFFAFAESPKQGTKVAEINKARTNLQSSFKLLHNNL
jgi:hypothetical protein